MNFGRREMLVSGLGLAAGVFLAAPVLGRPRSAGNAARNADHADLGELADAAVATKATPGVALAVWKEGREIYSHYAGKANLETGTSVVADSVFRVGSLTKQFTAALVLKLVSTGKLSLDDKVQTHLPFLGKHAPFTLNELLNHTAGVRDGDDTPVGPLSQIDQAERIAGMEPFFDFEPGTSWRYSNAGYTLVGAVIEKVSGLPLAKAAATLLFDPLKLAHTSFDSVGEVVPGRVSGYTPTADATAPFRNAEYLDVALAGAAGAMRSTVSDLCRWQHLLFRGRYIPLPLVRKMLMPGLLRNGALSGSKRHDPQDQAMGDTQYGLGLMLDTHTADRNPVAAHHGGINGFAAYLASHPTSGLTYACLCNADTHPGLPLRDIRRRVLADVLV